MSDEFTIKPGRELNTPFFPVANPLAWEGQLVNSVQDAFRTYGDRIESLTTFGVIAERPDPEGLATFYFAVDEGKLYFDGLNADDEAGWYWLGAEPVAMMAMVAEAGLGGETGLLNTNEDSILGSVASTRTVTVEPSGTSFTVWVQGQQFIKTSQQSVVLSADAGKHAVVFNSSGVLTDLGTSFDLYDIIRDNAYVAEVYVNDSEIKFLSDERHGLMDWRAHYQQHIDGGTVVVSGLGLTSFSVDGNGSVDAHGEFAGASGYILDEDLVSTVATSQNFPVLYRSGASGLWQASVDLGMPIVHSGGVPAWNEYTGGSWQLTPVTNGDYVLAHIFATPVQTVSDDPCNGYIAILGQSEYATVRLARQGANDEISNLVTDGLPMAEFAPVGSVIYRYRSVYSNSYMATVVSTDEGDDYVPWLNQNLNPGTPPGSHANLVDRNIASQHEAAALDADVTDFGGVLSSTDLTVQDALDTLDDHLHDDRYYTESEVDTLLTSYSGSSHTHDDRYYTEAEADAAFEPLGTTHDDRYYTESEMDSALSGKSATGHSHTESDISDLQTYLKSNGTVGLSADWDAGAHQIRAETFRSDVATGTAPFTVASTTKVTSLNADYLDGYSWAHFLRLAAASQISALTAKATPTTSDFLMIEDAAAGNAKRRITIGDLPSSGGGGSVPVTLGASGGELIGSVTGYTWWTLLDITSTAGFLSFLQNSSTYTPAASTWTKFKVTVDGTVIINYDTADPDVLYSEVAIGQGSAIDLVSPIYFSDSLKVEVYTYASVTVGKAKYSWTEW